MFEIPSPSPPYVCPVDPVCACVLSHFSRVRLFATPWAVAPQAPLSMGFSRQECWIGLPFPSPGDLPNPGIKPESSMSPALAVVFFTTSTTWEAQLIQYHWLKDYPFLNELPLHHICIGILWTFLFLWPLFIIWCQTVLISIALW